MYIVRIGQFTYLVAVILCISDFTSQVSDKLGSPIASGSSGDVYQCTIESSEGKTEAAVKVFKIDDGRIIEKTRMRILRELRVWLRLNHPAIVPLLGIAYIDPLFPALVSRWMSSATLDTHIRKQVNISTFARGLLVKGVADGLYYLHSENVVHGDLHPVCSTIMGMKGRRKIRRNVDGLSGYHLSVRKMDNLRTQVS